MNDNLKERVTRVAVVIPARYNSEEIQCKVLADIAGKPMIQHVYERVKQARGVGDVLVATDHEAIKAAVEGFGGRAIITRKDHHCGTDRVVEACRIAGIDARVVVNVQADEPFIEPGMIEEVAAPLLADESIPMATLCCEFASEEDFNYPFNVKVVMDKDGFALYFTRCPVPYQRTAEKTRRFQHVGIYAYQGWFIQDYPAERTPLEKCESLEQLRVLENGYRIKVVETRTPYRKVCVNTPEDLEKARKIALDLDPDKDLDVEPDPSVELP